MHTTPVDPAVEAWARAAVAAMLERVKRWAQVEYLQRYRELE